MAGHGSRHGDPIRDWSWAVEQAPVASRYRLVSAETAHLVFIGYVQGDSISSLTVGDGIDLGMDVSGDRPF